MCSLIMMICIKRGIFASIILLGVRVQVLCSQSNPSLTFHYRLLMLQFNGYYYILKTSTNLCFLLFVLGVRVRVLCARALRSLRTSGRPRWWLGWRLGLAWCSLCHATVTLNILGRQQHLQTPGSQNKSIASSGHKSHLRSDPQSSVMLYNRRGAVLHTEGTESEKLI